jgi:hypothetical protein
MRIVPTSVCLATLILGTFCASCLAADEAGAADNLFLRAAAAIRADSPAATSMEYPEAPPFGAEWDRVAKESWEKNAAVFPLVRQARLAAAKAPWPHGADDLHYLNTCRNLANIVGDAAMYQHLQGDDRAAVELVRDLLGLSESLRGDLHSNDLVRVLVSIGIDALAAYRLAVITSEVHLSDNPADARALQVADATALIKQLLQAPSSFDALNKMLKEDPKAIESVAIAGTPASAEASRALEQANRGDAERALVAMSLASHLFKREKGRWPANLDELATKLPAGVPRDPWGDGKQTFGYVLAKGAAPREPAERPLVYSRCESRDGLFYRVDGPQFGFNIGDGSDRPANQQKRGGQFRDVSNWQPKTGLEGVVGPKTRPVQ